MQYFDKDGREIKAGMKLLMEDGSIEMVYDTVDSYDESIVRQMIECIKVFKDGRLLVIFGGGYEVEINIEETE